MLQLQNLPEDIEAYEIVRRFVNDRLIRLIEDRILDEVDWDMAVEGELDESDFDKPFDELVDISKLLTDMDFAENVSLCCLPQGYPKEQANRQFFGLYNLLKAKKEYVPELAMEYILYRLINQEIFSIEMINDDIDAGMFDDMKDDPYYGEVEDMKLSTVFKISEPERTTVKNALMEQAKDRADEGETPEEYADYMLNQYENLNEYENICFWDIDFLQLDRFSEDNILASDMNRLMGIMDPKGSKVVNFPLEGNDGRFFSVSATLNVFPWDLEEE